MGNKNMSEADKLSNFVREAMQVFIISYALCSAVVIGILLWMIFSI